MNGFICLLRVEVDIFLVVLRDASSLGLCIGASDCRFPSYQCEGGAGDQVWAPCGQWNLRSQHLLFLHSALVISATPHSSRVLLSLFWVS